MVEFIKSEQEFDALIATGKKVAVDFTASWCGPCRIIGPVFEKSAEEFPDITFVKVDVDEQPEVSEKAGIQAMPTFQTFNGGVKVDEMKGAVPPKLKALLAGLQAL